MSEVRIIKKYPNRRLYDTAISSYITLEDVRRLILDEVVVKVIDARSQEEITHNTLLQIIVEQEEKGPHLFTIATLQEMIRLYGSPLQSMSREVLAQGLNFFTSSQNALKKESTTDKAALNQVLQSQTSEWQHLQQRWVQSLNEVSARPVDLSERPLFRIEEGAETT